MVPRNAITACLFAVAIAMAGGVWAQLSTDSLMGTWHLVGAGESEAEARQRAEGIDIRFEFAGNGQVAVFRDGELMGEDGFRVEPGVLVVIGEQAEQRWEVMASDGRELLIRLDLDGDFFYQYWHKQ